MGKAILPLFCGGFIVLVAGVCIGPSPLIAFKAALEGEAVYRRQPTRFWLNQLQDHDQSFRQEAGAGFGANWIERRKRSPLSRGNAHGQKLGSAFWRFQRIASPRLLILCICGGFPMYTDSFLAFMHRVRARDEAAAAQLVMQYQPLIQRTLCKRLLKSGLGRVLDTLDISQSVFGSFFARVARGEFELHSPADLRKLLVTMARNALRDHQRHFHRERYRTDEESGKCLAELAAKETAAPQPSQVLIQRELSERIREAMSYEDWCLAIARAEGRSWQEIAAECGETPNAVRMRLSRAMARIRRAFNVQN